MTNWLESIQDHLVANSLGTLESDLFIGGLEDGDDIGDPTTSIAPYSGLPGIETMVEGYAVKQPSLHVAVRGTGFLPVYDRIIAIRDLLQKVTDQTVQGTKFIRIAPTTSDPMYLNRDKNGRHMFSINFSVEL